MSSNPELKMPGTTERVLRGAGKKADRLVELSTILAAGIQQHYGINVPLHEVILPAAAIVWVLAHSLVQYLNTEA